MENSFENMEVCGYGAGDDCRKEIVSPSLAKETLIVFDWDDTILPTAWLERSNAFVGAMQHGNLRVEVQQKLAELASRSAATLSLSEKLGHVLLITNSSPGWVEQSCALFMPQLLKQIRGYKICAKPLQESPLTFKNGAFRRESRAFRNVVSIGDGDAERAAMLRMLPGHDRRPLPGGVDGDQDPASRSLKSVKLVDMPTCQQLLQQHDMLQVRLCDVVGCRESLDLKARFSAPQTPGALKGCMLAHFPGNASGFGGSALPPLGLGSRGGGAEPFTQLFSKGRSPLEEDRAARTPRGGLPFEEDAGTVASRSLQAAAAASGGCAFASGRFTPLGQSGNRSDSSSAGGRGLWRIPGRDGDVRVPRRPRSMGKGKVALLPAA